MDFCRFCRARLEEFLDGQLPPSEREKVAAHLESCADCARALGELESQARLSRAALGELPPAPAPPALRLKVRAALQNETARHASPWRFPAWARHWNPAKFAWSGGITFAAIALVILARPDSPVSFSPAPPSSSPPQMNRETKSAPSLLVAPPRAKPKAASKREKNAPRLTAPAPEVRTNAARDKTDAARARTSAETLSAPVPGAKTTVPGVNPSAAGAET
ncbi:MAG: zf-HC2 domain-containing protein, partial [Armatimonadetes bacterium]|nr:zf-HC2 domain-containing protein [Armatimonadota bacterium]